jgi:hypothetical protein
MGTLKDPMVLMGSLNNTMHNILTVTEPHNCPPLIGVNWEWAEEGLGPVLLNTSTCV